MLSLSALVELKVKKSDGCFIRRSVLHLAHTTFLSGLTLCEDLNRRSSVVGPALVFSVHVAAAVYSSWF